MAKLCKHRKHMALFVGMVLSVVPFTLYFTTPFHRIVITTDKEEKRVHQSIKPAKIQQNITIVTAYFEIGSFPKLNRKRVRQTSVYYEWAKAFRYMINNVVIYTDSMYFQLHMMEVRKDLMSMTKVFLIDRNSSWAFRNIDKIKDIFSQKHYPKFYPNTAVPEYACAVHAKLDVVSRAAVEDLFRTRYYCWLDIGYFRQRVQSKQIFYLTKPKQFNDKKIAMSRVWYNNNLSVSPEDVFLHNLKYVGAGVIFGEREIIIKFSSHVKQAVDYFLSQGLIGAEEQVIYAMYSNAGRKALKPEVELQCYRAPKDKSWFFLGNTMLRNYKEI